MADGATVDGLWKTVADGDGVADAEARLAFHGDTLILATRCTSSREVVTVGVTVKASYADGSLNVLESKDSARVLDIGDGRTATCRASLVAGDASYTLDHGTLAVLGLTLSKVADWSGAATATENAP